MAFQKRWKGFNINVLALLLWWIMPYSIMFLVSLKVPMFNNSYNLFNSIGLYLFISAMINFLYQKNKYFEPASGLVILIFMCVYMRILPNNFAYREVSKSVNFVKNAENENSIIILYPFWSDLQFTYYYNREIFTDHQNFKELMKKNGIYNVWNITETKQAIKANSKKRVIYVQDGQMLDPKSNIFKFLDSAYVKRDSAFFPQTTRVCIYDPKSE
ncbi:MAG: hypothetical protein M0Q51_12510 [Bacteroidales bacterium]|nr:hypothetical protein [Bacteroidales bacterium]